MIYDKLYQQFIKQVSAEIGIPTDVVFVAYRSQWEFIRKHIQELNIKDVETEEEFDNLRVSFNIPSMGKLYTTWDKVSKIKRRAEYIKRIKEDEESKTN